MTITFAILAILTIAAAVAAMSLKNLVHCALAMVGAFGGLAALFLQLEAQFVGFAQVLVYIGAVAILIVFAILFTRGGEASEKALFSSSWIWGAVVAVGVFGILVWAIRGSFLTQGEQGKVAKVNVSVEDIGTALMTKFVLPFEVVGLLLTAAMLGAVIIAMKDESPKKDAEHGKSSGGHP